MRDRLLSYFPRGTDTIHRSTWLFFAGLWTLSWLAALWENHWIWLLAVPVAFILYLSILDFRIIFFLLLGSIPLSTEMVLENGLGTDLPTEPLIIGLMLVGWSYFLLHFPKFGGAFLSHPVTLLLLLHLAWTLVTTLHSRDMVVSLKFLLAKGWYLSTFYFLAAYLLRPAGQIRIMVWVLIVPALLSIGIIWIRHATFNFSFEDIRRVLHPFQRNHVNYAAMLSLLLPWVLYLRGSLNRGSRLRALWWALVVVWLAAILLSYTRAAYLAILLAAFAALLLRIRWFLPVVYLTLGLTVAVIAGLSRKNSYLDLAPNYDRTISHTQFDDLMDATVKMEDISTMERLYRWVAGAHMSVAEPWLGFGPGTFTRYYKPFTVSGFRTYVSDNEEKSGIHSYFLMVLVEQGFPGLFIFLLFILAVLHTGQRIISRKRNSPTAMAATASFIVILVFLSINDLVETDKIGSFFFLCAALLVHTDLLEMGKSPEGPNDTRTEEESEGDSQETQ